MFGAWRRRNRQEDGKVEVAELDGVRTLHIGSATVQSAMRLAAPYALELRYARGIMTFLLFLRQVRDVLAIGLGGGSIPKFIHHHLAHTAIRVVEISPQVIALARSHFGLPAEDARFAVIAGDGAQYLPQHPQSADVLILDVFDSAGVPPGLYAQDFFDHCAGVLRAEGVMAVNLWGSDRNFDLYFQRIAQSFAGGVLRLPTGHPGNVVVFGFRRTPDCLRWSTLRQRARTLQQDLDIEFLEFVERLRDNNPGTAHRLTLNPGILPDDD